MNTPKTYRKKPVEIQAMLFDGTTADTHAVYLWIEENTQGSFESLAVLEGDVPSPPSGVSIDPEDGRMMIATLEGIMKADLGDYIIKGVAGEFYPCKPDIFAATYEEVDQDGNRVNSTQYPESANTPVMTVAAILEWLEGEKEDVESTRKDVESAYGALGTMTVNVQAETVQTLIDNLTKSTFQQMDEAHGNE